MYEVIFDEEAIEFLNTLPKEIKERIFKKIISSKEMPVRNTSLDQEISERGWRERVYYEQRQLREEILFYGPRR